MQIAPPLRAAVIIPTISGRPFVEQAIASIKAQAMPADILIVAPAGAPILASGVTVIRLRENLGSAGGYFIGGRWAYDQAYELIIFADDDAILDEHDTIERLMASRRQGRPVSYIALASGGPFLPNLYGTMGREVLQKIGFHFKDFFHVREDIELDWRLRRHGYEPAVVRLGKFTHPAPGVSKKTYSPGLLYYVARNSIAFKLGYGRLASAMGMWLMYSSILLSSLMGGRPGFAGALGRSFADVLTGRLGERSIRSSETLESETGLSLADVAARRHVIVGYAESFSKPGLPSLNIVSSGRLLSLSEGLGSLKNMLELMRAAWGMDYVIYESSEMRYSFLSYFGKQVLAYRALDGKLALIRRNGLLAPLQAGLCLGLSALWTLAAVLPLIAVSFIYKKRFLSWEKESIAYDIGQHIAGVEKK